MKMLSLSAAILLGTASLGFSQQAPTQPADMQPAPAEKSEASPPPPPGRPGPDMRRPDGPPGMHRPGPGKAAHFRIKQGDTRLDIKCAEDEPMKACADLVMQILDRANNGDHANANTSDDNSRDRGSPPRDYGRQRW